ncbi:MAG: polysaccharide deacetylase family protein [Oceanospirillaceae bacterium]
MSSWQILAEEIQQWQSPIPFWWRDDDAVANTGALQKMLAIADKFAIPVHLAVIPNALEDSLQNITLAAQKPNCYVLQHGFEHHSFALQGQRKIELGGSQEINVIQSNLSDGRKRLQAAFADQYLDILVPPWNRISDEIAAKLPDIGYQKLSILGGAKVEESEFLLNVHIDIINWKQRCFAGEALILAKITAHLRELRLKQQTPLKPCGLMTHHLDHDFACWQFIEQFFSFCQNHPQIRWISGDALYTY